MNRRQFISGLLMAGTLLLAGTSPAMAARLVTVEVEAGETQATQAGTFRLGAQTRVTLNYNATIQGNNGHVVVNVYRKLPNDRWQLVGTPVDIRRSQNGKHEMTLHAGEYKVEIVATNANVTVTVDN